MVACPVSIGISSKTPISSGIEDSVFGATGKVPHNVLESINMCTTKVTCIWCKQSHHITNVRAGSHSGVGERSEDFKIGIHGNFCMFIG